MLPLAGAALPTDSTSLALALANGFRLHGLEPRQIRASGDAWPNVEQLTIDLTGAEASRALRPPEHPRPSGGEIAITSFELRAEPIYLEKIPVRILAAFSSAQAAFSQAANGALFLRLLQAASGEVETSVTHAEMERGLLALASEAAAKHGAEVKSTHLELETPTPRTLVFRAAVTAKVFIMKTTVRVRGRIDLDDALNARLSGLAADGDGMLASIVQGSLRPHLARLESQTFALGALVAGGLRVSDVSISAGPVVRLHATFAGTSGGATS